MTEKRLDGTLLTELLTDLRELRTVTPNNAIRNFCDRWIKVIEEEEKA